MKKIKSVIILKILVCAYLLMGLVFMGNLFLISLNFKHILPDSLTNIIFELVLGNFMIASFVSFSFGCLATWLILGLKSDREIVKNVTVDEGIVTKIK